VTGLETTQLWAVLRNASSFAKRIAKGSKENIDEDEEGTCGCC
jgi:hypothetical protein